MTTNIGPRPANPSEISFESRCFEQVGTEIEYTVTRSAIHSGPARFATIEQAAAFAKRTGRTVEMHERPVMRRIAWR